jgi:hypothetical protein
MSQSRTERGFWMPRAEATIICDARWKRFCEHMIESATFWKIPQQERHQMNQIKHLPCGHVVERVAEISVDAGLLPGYYFKSR